MTALVITLLVLFGIGLIPVGVQARYDEDLSVSLTVLGIPIRLYPMKRNKPKKETKKSENPRTKKKKKKLPSRKTLEEYLHLFLEILGRLRKKLLLRKLKLHAVFGGSDPADAALNYGRAWAAIGLVMPLFDAGFRIKERDVGAYRTREETSLRLYAEAHATLRISQILHIALLALVRFLKIHKQDSKEGGATV